jgi:hypothetical protein
VGGLQRASLFTSWSSVSSPEEARRALMETDFDPAAEVMLEGTGALPPPTRESPSGSVSYRETGPAGAVIEVEVNEPAIVVIRTPYDPNWAATVDSRPVRVLPANYVIQAVPVGAGRHTIVMSYREPSVGRGVAGSVLFLAALLGAALLLLRRPTGGTRSSGFDPAHGSSASIGRPTAAGRRAPHRGDDPPGRELDSSPEERHIRLTPLRLQLDSPARFESPSPKESP